MKLTPEQLGDWFFTTNPRFPSEMRARWLEMLKSPPEGATRSEVISGMKQGINDTLTMAPGWDDDRRETVDEALTAKGLHTLRKMEAVLKKKHQRVLKRGSIKNDEEYYIVAEILNDLDFDVSAAERATLEKLSAEYTANAE